MEAIEEEGEEILEDFWKWEDFQKSSKRPRLLTVWPEKLAPRTCSEVCKATSKVEASTVTTADAGQYSVRITNSVAGCNAKTFNSNNGILTVIAPQTVTSVSNPVFSPNQASSAGTKDNTVITVNNPTASVSGITVRLRAGTALGGTLVRELSIGTLAGGANGTVTWDGMDGTGSFVAEGTYTTPFSIQAFVSLPLV